MGQKINLDLDYIKRTLRRNAGMMLLSQNGHEKYQFPLNVCRDRNKRIWICPSTPSDHRTVWNVVRDLRAILKDFDGLLGYSTRKEKQAFEQGIITGVVEAPKTPVNNTMAQQLGAALAEPTPEAVSPAMEEKKVETAVVSSTPEVQLPPIPELPTIPISGELHRMVRAKAASVRAEAFAVLDKIKSAETEIERLTSQRETDMQRFRKLIDALDALNMNELAVAESETLVPEFKPVFPRDIAPMPPAPIPIPTYPAGNAAVLAAAVPAPVPVAPAPVVVTKCPARVQKERYDGLSEAVSKFYEDHMNNAYDVDQVHDHVKTLVGFVGVPRLTVSNACSYLRGTGKLERLGNKLPAVYTWSANPFKK